MNRTQQKQLDDLVRRFSAERAEKPALHPTRLKDQPVAEPVKLSPRLLVALALLTLIVAYLLIAF